MAKLESLIVDLQVNSAALKEGLESANKKLDAFDKNLKDLAGVVVFEKFAKQAFSAASSLVNFAMAGAEAADHMGKLAASTGMSVESFSRLAYAGDLSGVSADALAGALVKLDSNMSKAATGGKEQAPSSRRSGSRSPTRLEKCAAPTPSWAISPSGSRGWKTGPRRRSSRSTCSARRAPT